MSNLKLIVLGLVLLKFAFVVSQAKTCTGSDDCGDNKCCYNGVCTNSSSLKCILLKSQRTCSFDYPCSIGCCVNGSCGECSSTCDYDWQCTDGCCVNSQCKRMNSSECYFKNKTCNLDSDCDSGCCRNLTCQHSNFCRNTTALPTFGTTSKKCCNDSDCGYHQTGHRNQCCRNGQCQLYCWPLTTGTSKFNFIMSILDLNIYYFVLCQQS